MRADRFDGSNLEASSLLFLGVEEAVVYADQFKVHETALDRKRQREILEKFARRFDLKIWELSKFARQDAWLYRRGVHVGIAEARYRNMRQEWYPRGYGVDEAKIDRLFAAAELRDVYGYHIVSWKGDVWYLNVTRALWEGIEPGVYEMADPWDTFWWKRQDRDELPDKWYCIPHSWFKRVELNDR